jgi:hypothetical protein
MHGLPVEDKTPYSARAIGTNCILSVSVPTTVHAQHNWLKHDPLS